MSTVDTTLIDRPSAAAGRYDALAPSRRDVLAVTALAAVLAAAVAVRFINGGALWFDETQSVAIANLPLSELFGALRQDGSPPLYYVLLHFWMDVFGTSTAAVRALSGLCSIAALPPVWVLARRVLPRTAALPALILVATSPMAIRYALEVRMYALEPALIALGALALLNVLERPTWRRVAALAAVSGALSLTHYWALFLLAAVAVTLLPRAFRGSRPHLAALGGLLGGGLFFAPWLPSALFQIQHTGTPWSHAAIYEVLEALPAWGGADEITEGLIKPTAAILVPVLMALVAYGLLRSRRARPIAGVAGLTLLLAGIVSVALNSAVVPRYLTVGLLPYLLVAATGIGALRLPWRNVALAAVATLGLTTGVLYGVAPRTIAPQVVKVLEASGTPSDVVVYCPDQLGPDVHRLLPDWPRQQLFPTGAAPGRVNWVNYSTRNLASRPASYARGVVSAAGPSTIWLLEAHGFAEYHGRCGQLGTRLAQLRPRNRLMLTGFNPMDPSQRESLVQYLPASRAARPNTAALR